MQKLSGMKLSKFGPFGAGSSKMAVQAEFLQLHTTQFLHQNTSKSGNQYLTTISTCEKNFSQIFFEKIMLMYVVQSFYFILCITKQIYSLLYCRNIQHTTDEKLYCETKRDREQTRIIAATHHNSFEFIWFCLHNTHTYSNLEDILKR